MSRKIKLIGILLISFSSLCFAQNDEHKSSFFQPEYLFGKIIPVSSYGPFPEDGYQHAIAISYGVTNSDTTKWGRYYNQPETGLMFLYSNLGNNEVFGHQFG